MASTLASTWRSFWHTMTSNDRHASHDSPYRTGQHVPLPQSRHAPLTSVTSALDSRTDLSSPYAQNPEAGHGFVTDNGPMSPKSPYAPGMRSNMQQQSSGKDAASYNMDAVSTGEIQMQNFSDGLPPPPPVSHSWKRIDRWMEENYEELFENLGIGCTQNDLNELEHELDCTLPQEVRESLQIHDGQERGGMPTGVIFGCMLLDGEEIIHEWQNWRVVNEEYLREPGYFPTPQAPIKAFAGASSSVAPAAHSQQSPNPNWRQELLDKQDSQPPNAIQRAYAHPAWIPLARDWGGNNIAVDLAPGPTGKWGQIIIMGRDYDCKYVIARSWSHFLASLADDLSTDKWFIDDESKELKLGEFRQQGVEPGYLDILRWRADQKHGRKGPKRRSGQPLRINSNIAGVMNGVSPYASPTSATDERGRSPQRFANHKAPASSNQRAHISSPLARVAEEMPLPMRPQSASGPDLRNKSVDTVRKLEKLVSIDSPIPGDEQSKQANFPAKSHLSSAITDEPDEFGDTARLTAKSPEPVTDLSMPGGAAEEMRNVEI